MGDPVVGTNLVYRYEGQSLGRLAIDQISLHVRAGEFVCVMGPSGSGKSTLIRLVAGLQKPQSGSLRVGALEISSADEDQAARFRRRHVGLVFQFFDLIPDFTLRQNVALQLLMDGRRMRDVREKVDALLDQLGLGHRADHSLTELSGGELQRVAIARALAVEPTLILADEPTANLEEQSSDEIIHLLKTTCNVRGVTTMVVTHNPAFQDVADRTLWMSDGHLHKTPLESLHK